MKRPTWAIVVGILMICFGGCGISNDIQQIYTEELSEFSLELFGEIDGEVMKDSLSNTEQVLLGIPEDKLDDGPINIMDEMKNMSQMSPEALKIVIKHGYIGIVVSLIFILAGILFLTSKKYTIVLGIISIAISILFVFFQIYEMNTVEMHKIMRWGLNINLFFGLGIDIILLVVILILDKTFFRGQNLSEEYYDGLDPL